MPGLDTYAGDGTTRVAPSGLAAADSLQRRRPLVIALGISVLVAAALITALVVSGALSGTRTDLAAATEADAATNRPALPVDAETPLTVTPADAGDTVAVIPDADAPSPVPDAAVSPVPALTTLEIVTRPAGARAVVDREPARTTPAILRDRPPGKATIVVTRDGYATVTRTIELAAGEHRTIELVLDKKSGGNPRVGYLTARTQPYAVVYLGSRKLGETPFAGVELPVGRHVLTFKNPGKRPVTRTVTVRAGQTIKLNFPL